MTSAVTASSPAGTVVRFVGTLAGHVAGGLFGGSVVGPLAYEMRNPEGRFGYEFEGLGEVLIFGALFALVGAVLGNLGAATVAERLGGSHRPSRRGGRAVLEGLGYAFGLVGPWLLVATLGWAAETALGLVFAAGGAILGFAGGGRIAAHLPPPRVERASRAGGRRSTRPA